VALKGEDACVCGTPMTAEMRESIRLRSDEFLDGSRMISAVAMQSAFPATEPHVDLEDLGNQLQAASDEFFAAQTEYEAELAGGMNTKTKVRRTNLQKERDRLRDQIRDHEFELRVITETSLTWILAERKGTGLSVSRQPVVDVPTIKKIENLDILRRVEENLTKKLEEAGLSNNAYQGLKLAREVFSGAIDELIAELQGEISAKAVEAWHRMPAAGGDAGLSLRVTETGIVYERNGSEASGVSGAQSVSASYAVAAAITSLGDISIPLVADTPFAGWDEEMVPKWHIGVASEFHQFVLMINTSEKRLLEPVWSSPDSELHLASIRQEGLADDGGRKFVFTNDPDIFKDLTAAGDK
jgi:hypothetical protein